MGMGHFACHADVVEDQSLAAICPAEWAKLAETMERAGLKFYDIARDCEMGEDLDTDVEEALNELRAAFEETTGGLRLSLGYHDQEGSGSRYDDIDGHYWGVGGVYDYTPAGRKYKHIIRRANWVDFG